MEVKFCKDCKFCRRDKPSIFLLLIPILGWIIYLLWIYVEGLRFAKCIHPNSQSIEAKQHNTDEYLVTGNKPKYKTWDHYFCTTMRKFDCGQEARFFSPK